MDNANLRFIAPVERFCLTGPPGKPEKETENVHKERSANNAEGGNSMNIFNYGFANPMNAHIEIDGDTIRCQSTQIDGITFRGYPILRIDDLVLENCVFENCKTVYFSDCKVDQCRFDSVETVFADRTPIGACNFAHLHCNNDCILSLEDSHVSFCTFKDVALTNEAYLVNGNGDVWIENCSFENIRTDRADRELFFCEETVGKVFKKSVQYCIADTESCSGLDGVQCTVESKIQDNPLDDLWVQATQRGLHTEKARAAMRDGVRWDESKWDAHTLERSFGDMITKIPVYNCLTRAGLRTVGDLVRLDIEQILKIKNLGKTAVAEVVALLHSLNITDSAWDYFV